MLDDVAAEEKLVAMMFKQEKVGLALFMHTSSILESLIEYPIALWQIKAVMQKYLQAISVNGDSSQSLNRKYRQIATFSYFSAPNRPEKHEKNTKIGI